MSENLHGHNINKRHASLDIPAAKVTWPFPQLGFQSSAMLYSTLPSFPLLVSLVSHTQICVYFKFRVVCLLGFCQSMNSEFPSLP